jgi:pimeloyl-ACP methyl ester carboxylesterase
VGQGMGGVLALLALAAHPGSARGLVLIDASLKSPTPADSSQRAGLAQMIDQNYASISRSLFTHLGRDSAQGAAIRAQAARLPPATIKAYLLEMMLMDVTPALGAARLPILAIGTERVWTADKDSRAVVKQMGYEAPGIEVRRMAGCGFMVASEKPDSLVALIDAFAAKVRARR